MRHAACTVMVCAALVFVASSLTAAAPATDAPADRVVVMYFHRTQRCPTCLRMGSYAEKAVTTGFASQLKDRKVAFHYIDFQDAKNAAFADAYQVTGPTLIVARVAGNKVAEFKNLTEIWAKARDEAAFIEYVQSNVKAYLK